MATELILIRHGNAVRVNGHYVSAPLTPLGQRQADATGRYFCRAHEHFDGFYCSPLRRARETAARIGLGTGQLPHVRNGLQELNGLEVPQLVLCESLARVGVFGHYLYETSGRPLTWPIIGRVSTILTRLIEEHPDQRVTVVAHSGVISAVLAWYFPGRRRHWWRYTVDNCSLTRLRIDGAKAQALAINDTNHLKPEITTTQPPEPAVELANAATARIAPTAAGPLKR